jgi:hypothetical protein
VSFEPIARHYAVGIDVCPAYHAWRKGAVEKAAGVITQRWSRTLGDEVTADQAQAGLDRLCVRLDGPKRRREGITPPRWARWPRPRGCDRYLRGIRRCWECRAR